LWDKLKGRNHLHDRIELSKCSTTIMSYLNYMKRNSHIPSLFRSFPSHWMAVGCFLVDGSLQHRYGCCHFTSNTCRASVTLLHRLTLQKTWTVQRYLWKFQISWSNFYPLYIDSVVCRLPILFWPIEAQILNVSEHYVEVLCAPSATQVSWEQQSQNTVLRIGVLVAFNSSLLCSMCIIIQGQCRFMWFRTCS
jgi:hypothetical protein